MPDHSIPDQTHSVTHFIQRLKDEDPEAARQIWLRYFERLLPLARARLRTISDRALDEEDVLVSVFDRFFLATKEQRFARLQDRDDLWQILLMLTERKVSDQYRRAGAQKRSHDRTGAESPGFAESLQNAADPEPGPAFVAAFNDSIARAMGRLSEPVTREVAVLKMEGWQNREIAERLSISLTSVERKLRLIREVWQHLAPSQ